MSVDRSSPSRIAVLHTKLAGYSVACLERLAEVMRNEVLVFYRPPASEAPFDLGLMSQRGLRLVNRQRLSDEAVLDILLDYEPDAVVLAGWMHAPDVAVARKVKSKRGVPLILSADNQWYGNLRQVVGLPYLRHVVLRDVDVMWVPGDRQRQYARRLGYEADRCWTGVYSCDWERFSQVNGRPRDNMFLFVGRFVQEKGIHALVNAYGAYRATCESPWKLTCVGAGPLEEVLHAVEGIEVTGFVQPDRLPELLGRAKAFVMPSHYEPWGVAIHEATANGLPVITTDACGASAHLAVNGYNGFVIRCGDERGLAQAMSRISSLSESRLDEMSQASMVLSKQFTPSLWAETLICGIRDVAGSYQSGRHFRDT